MNRDRFLLALPISLLIALVLVDAKYHLLLGMVTWAVLRATVGDIHRSLGRARRWLQGLLVLCLLGAVFGPSDRHAGAWAWSLSGLVAGSTMTVRAYAIVALTSLASSVLPVRQWIRHVRSPVVQRLLEVIVVAINLVPVQVRALSIASTTLSERRPGLGKLPRRLWLLAIHSSLRAAMLAENVALDIAIAAHNAGGDRKVAS